jgi:hypothetical protein
MTKIESTPLWNAITFMGCSLIIGMSIININLPRVVYVKTLITKTANVSQVKKFNSVYALVDQSIGLKLQDVNGATVSNCSITKKPFDSTVMIIKDYIGEEK